MNFEKLNKDKVNEIRHKVELDAEQLNDLVTEITKPYTEELDNYVTFIKDILSDGNNPATTQELEDFCINLSTYLYYAGAMQERLGIKDDISKALYREMYNNCRQAQEKGTIADRNAYAELASLHEEMVSVVYKRSFTLVKAKVQASQELLSSCKKVLTRRMQEQEMSNFMGGR